MPLLTPFRRGRVIRAALATTLALAGCVTTDPFVETKDTAHARFLLSLDQKCRQLARKMLVESNYTDAHYLLSKPLGRLHQTHIILSRGPNRPGQAVLCENEMPRPPAVNAMPKGKVADFLRTMRSFEREAATGEMNYEPSSMSQGLQTHLAKSGSGADAVKVKVYWLPMAVIKELAPDYFDAF